MYLSLYKIKGHLVKLYIIIYDVRLLKVLFTSFLSRSHDLSCEPLFLSRLNSSESFQSRHCWLAYPTSTASVLPIIWGTLIPLRVSVRCNKSAGTSREGFASLIKRPNHTGTMALPFSSCWIKCKHGQKGEKVTKKPVLLPSLSC